MCEVKNLIQQVVVIDENGTQIGMTFPKRAKQLINKQRALWHDEAHTTICLLPEMKEDTILENDFTNRMSAGVEKTIGYAEDNNLLLFLAQKNVTERKNLIKHIMAYVATGIVVVFLYASFFVNSVHPFSSEAWNAIRYLDEIRPLIPESYIGNIDEVDWFINYSTNNYTHPLWYIILGVMFAWGGWITVNVVKRAIRYYMPKFLKKAKPDPIILEYQRLKNMVSDGMAIEKF